MGISPLDSCINNIIYSGTYKNGNIWLHSIQYAGQDFAKVFY